VTQPSSAQLTQRLSDLKLPFVTEHFEVLAQKAAQKKWDHISYLARLIEGEAAQKAERSIQRRIKLARFPVIKTLDSFVWKWPKQINRLQIQNLFRLKFIEHHANVIFLGGVGLGKTHLSTALAYTACLAGITVRFVTAVDAINMLSAAQASGRFPVALKQFLKPQLIVLDELGYLPIDKTGADLLFQIISHRYEHGSIIITSNRSYKKWPEIFNDDATLTSAILDRLLHHAETIVIEGKSYRMKDHIEKQ